MCYMVPYVFVYRSTVICFVWPWGSNILCLQKHCKEHFEEEERDLLPLVEATELSSEQQKRVLAQCVSAMQGTHSRLFNFFLEGLAPEEAMQYLDLTTYAVIKNNLSPNFVWLFGKIDIYSWLKIVKFTARWMPDLGQGLICRTGCIMNCCGKMSMRILYYWWKICKFFLVDK